MGKLVEAVPRHVLEAILRQGAASASSLAVTELNAMEMQEQPTVTKEPPALEPTLPSGSSTSAARPEQAGADMEAKKGGGEVRPGAEVTAPNPKQQKTTAEP